METARTLVSSEIIKEPADRVVLVGTKVKSSFKKTASTPAAYKKVIAMTATAYVAGGTTATGRPAQWGVVAVDPRVIPLGTRVYVETADGQYIYGTAVAADTGGAIKGNKIDICAVSYTHLPPPRPARAGICACRRPALFCPIKHASRYGDVYKRQPDVPHGN